MIVTQVQLFAPADNSCRNGGILALSYGVALVFCSVVTTVQMDLEAGFSMKFRQILTVLVFMVAAVVMKNALPNQSMINPNAAPVVNETGASNLVALLSPEVMYAVTLEIPGRETAASSAFIPMPVPGSVIALVVTVLSLVSIARRAAS